MKKPIITLFIFSFIFLSISAQDKLLSLQDAIYMNRDIYPASIPQLQWLGDSDQYAFAKENAIYKVTAKRGTETLLFDLDMLNTGRLAGGDDSLKRLPRINLYKDDAAYFKSGNTYYEYNFRIHELKKITQVPDTAGNIEFNRPSSNVAFTIKNNLFYTKDGEVKQITFEADPGKLIPVLYAGKLCTAMSLASVVVFSGRQMVASWLFTGKMKPW